MFIKNEKIFYIDLFENTIEEGRFIEYDKNGAWIKLKKQLSNTFVYLDVDNILIYDNMTKAIENMALIRYKIKEKLLSNNSFVEDIINKIRPHEGNLYADIIREILEEYTKNCYIR